MYAEERQRAVLQWARREGRVDVGTLAEVFDVTRETIRRDLTVLEQRGFVRRVHGGALPVLAQGFEPAVAQRATTMTAEKERIAKAALAELPDEGVLLLDAGTTTAALADLIPVDSQVRVVTNSLPIAMTLGLRPALTVLLVGGRVRARTLALVDTWALRTIEGMLVDVAFMATNGISLERGLTTPDTAEAAVKHAMVAAARRVVLLADHTKFGLEHFDRFATLEDVHAVYTDTGLDEDLAARIETRGPRVVRA